MKTEHIYKPSVWGAMYHSLPHREALGAGAAGPGKSWVLLMEPLAQIVSEHARLNQNHPHHIGKGESVGWALHLRRTSTMLDQTLDRAHRVFPRLDPGVKWSASELKFTFTSGYKYQFGHCKDPYDWVKYDSNEYTIALFDELTQFLEEQYEMICSRVRTADPVLQPMLKNRAMSNPLVRREAGESFTIEDPNWVRKYFVDPAPDGNVTLVRKVKRDDGAEEELTRVYLPATLYDNPDKSFVKSYELTLLGLKPHMKAARLYGNWYVTPDSFYADVWNPQIHTCEPFAIPPDWKIFRSMDWGFRKPGCVHWWGMDKDGTLWCVYEMTFQGKDAGEVADEIKSVERLFGWANKKKSFLTGPADTQLWEERGTVAQTMATTMAQNGVLWVPAKKGGKSFNRTENARRLYSRLKDHAGESKTPGLVIFKDCTKLIQTLPAIQTDVKFPESPEDGGEDHWHDSACYAVAYASRGRKAIPGVRRVAKSRRASDNADVGRNGYGQRVC